MSDDLLPLGGALEKALKRLRANIEAKAAERPVEGTSEPEAAPSVSLTPQIELFIATARAAAPKDELATMEHPVYAIEDGDQRILTYEHNGVTLEVTPSVKGRATIHDKDIVLTCVSKVVDVACPHSVARV